MKTKQQNFVQLYQEIQELEKKLKELKKELEQLEKDIINGDLPCPKNFKIIEIEGRVSPSYQSILIHALEKQPRNIVQGIIRKASEKGKIQNGESKNFIEFIKQEWKKHNPPIKRKKVVPL